MHKIIKEDVENIISSISDISHKLEGKTVLVVGGAGFLGKYLVLTLQKLNEQFSLPCKIVIVDNFITGYVKLLEDFFKRNSIDFFIAPADDTLFDVLGTGYALWVRDGNLSHLSCHQRLRSQRDSGNYIYGSITVDI